MECFIKNHFTANIKKCTTYHISSKTGQDLCYHSAHDGDSPNGNKKNMCNATSTSGSGRDPSDLFVCVCRTIWLACYIHGRTNNTVYATFKKGAYYFQCKRVRSQNPLLTQSNGLCSYILGREIASIAK